MSSLRDYSYCVLFSCYHNVVSTRLLLLTVFFYHNVVSTRLFLLLGFLCYHNVELLALLVDNLFAIISFYYVFLKHRRCEIMVEIIFYDFSKPRRSNIIVLFSTQNSQSNAECLLVKNQSQVVKNHC